MREPIRLSASRLDDIAQLLRLGLALYLVGSAIASYQLTRGPSLSPNELWDYFGIHEKGAELLTRYLLSGEDPLLTPREVLALVFGCQVVGAFSIFFGLVTRFFASIFMFMAFLIWGVHFFDTTPWLLDSDNISSLAGPIAELRQVSIGLIFLALMHLGAGGNSLDSRLKLSSSRPTGISWNTIGLQLRLALSLFFFAAAISDYVFHTPFYEPSWFTLGLVGFLVFFGQGHRLTGVMSLMLIGWHLYFRLSEAATFSAAAETFLPETPLLVAAIIFLVAGGGERLKPEFQIIETKWGKVN